MLIPTQRKFVEITKYSTKLAAIGFQGTQSDVHRHFQELADIDLSLIPRPTIIWSWMIVSMTWHQLHLWS